MSPTKSKSCATRRSTDIRERNLPMNPFEMVIGIVLIVTIGSIIRAKYGVHSGFRGRRGHDGPEFVPHDDAETKALKAEIRALKERIQVLERIATDSNRAASLDDEIEKRSEEHTSELQSLN